MLLAGAACALSPSAASAQVNNLNLQTTLDTFKAPLLPAQPAPLGPKDGLTLDNKCHSKNDPAIKNKALQYRKTIDPAATVVFYDLHPELLERDFVEAQRASIFGRRKNLFTAFPVSTVNYACHTKQPINVTLSLPLNPTWESNVLRNPANNSPGFSLGFGGAAMISTPGIEGRPLDLVAYSVSSASARYPTFISKSLDSITEQAAYQIFLKGFYYPNGKQPLTEFDGNPQNIPKELPATNLITFDTLSLGVQNQTAFLPGLRPETADLFTPQATFARSNASLFGPGDACKSGTPIAGVDTSGFCHYLDWSMTAGQTLSDVPTQQNTNFAGSVTPGWRIRDTDWKVTLPTVVTSRFYNDVVGGRRDVLFQIGPALSYSKPPTGSDEAFISFSIAATYNQNFSTLATASWRGVIIQPTLTIAFIPPRPAK